LKDHFQPDPLSAILQEQRQYAIFTLKSIYYKKNNQGKNPNQPMAQNQAFFYAQIATCAHS